MKRILCLLLSFALMASFMGVVASAASVNDKMREDIVAAMPDDYEEVYLPQVEKILDQLTLTEGQYTQLKAIMDETVAEVDLTKGNSLHYYSEAENDYFIAQFDRICSIVGVTYTLVQKPGTTDDVVCYVYEDGKLLGTLDGDINAGKTDNATSAWAWALVAVAVVVLAGGVVVYARKKSAAK